MKDIRLVAAGLGLTDDQFETRGHHAKIGLNALDLSEHRARYVLVTATTPNTRGIGKTVTALGLGMALRAYGRSAVSLRQSSLGPTLGMKGGGAGGGKASVVPLDHSLLGLGADLFAVESANNLLAAVVDDAIWRGFPIDPGTVSWRRVLDMDDRTLRSILVAANGKVLEGPGQRVTGFDITAASEVMAVLALSRDLEDLRARLARIVPAWDTSGAPVTAGGLGAAGAMAVLLRDALQPNLMQTADGTPVTIHSGPFGTLAAGNSSVIGDRILLPRVDYLVTEAGFGSDLGAEKFFHLKAPRVGQSADAVVLVTTVAALREHGGGDQTPDVITVEKGAANLRRHLGILARFGAPVVVAVNLEPGDTPEEVEVIRDVALDAGAAAAVAHTAYTEGSEGCGALAEAVAAACRTPRSVPGLYSPSESPESKVETLATEVYGAVEVVWSATAKERLAQLVDAGYGRLPICMAKTHKSLSADPALIGAPTGFSFPVRDLRLAAGAGYITVLAGEIATMPGLPKHPHLKDIDLDEYGDVVGLT
jgi:formate--tetrahydrofolate ligase